MNLSLPTIGYLVLTLCCPPLWGLTMENDPPEPGGQPATLDEKENPGASSGEGLILRSSKEKRESPWRDLFPSDDFSQWSRVNGEKVVQTNLTGKARQNAFHESKYSVHKDFGHWTGPILLQDHGDEVWFRNLRIRDLSKAP